MIALAHRGLWFPDRTKQNTPEAVEAAVKAGLGVEIDVWLGPKYTQSLPDLLQKEYGEFMLHVGHDPSSTQFPYVEPISGYFSVLRDAPLIAWNVKTKGCAPMIEDVCLSLGIQDRSFAFDHELVGEGEWWPGVYEDSGPFSLLWRASDNGKDLSLDVALSKPGEGVWLDSFDTNWVTSDVIKAVHDSGKKAYVVSPELHGRQLDLSLWFEWAEADGICTDYPHLLQALMNGDGLHPKEPWW